MAHSPPHLLRQTLHSPPLSVSAMLRFPSRANAIVLELILKAVNLHLTSFSIFAKTAVFPPLIILSLSIPAAFTFAPPQSSPLPSTQHALLPFVWHFVCLIFLYFHSFFILDFPFSLFFFEIFSVDLPAISHWICCMEICCCCCCRRCSTLMCLTLFSFFAFSRFSSYR